MHYNFTKSNISKRYTLSVLEKGIDGRFHSISCPEINYIKVVDKNGKTTQKKMSRKQIEKQLLQEISKYYLQ